jgi:uncharacterized protein (DUF1800 family)
MQVAESLTLRDWDPATAWQPWQPAAAQPWNRRWAAHLLRRTAFGYPAARANEDALSGLNRAVAQGLPATLDELFQAPDASFEEITDTAGQSIVSEDQADDLRGWWFYRMLRSPTPLRERMTLFWHNHFATSIDKVRDVGMMFEQNRTLREHALGKFEPLVQAVGRDPAMIVWLDLEQNVNDSINENFGRELMELFTLGVGNYSEADVRTMARAFTGWRTLDGKAEFVDRLHDGGKKTIFGQSGGLDGQAAVRILLKQPATARFIVRKLFRHFVSEAESPSDALLEPLVDQFRQSELDVGQVLRRMLSSRMFFSSAAYRQRIKSPVEFVVGAVLGVSGDFPMQPLVAMMQGLGQELFAPPNVKGWDGGKAWLNTATLLARDNFVWKLVGGQADASYCDPASLAKSHSGSDAASQIDFLADLFLQNDIDGSVKRKLVDYLKHDSPTGAAWDRRLRETLHMLLVLPEYQLA